MAALSKISDIQSQVETFLKNTEPDAKKTAVLIKKVNALRDRITNPVDIGILATLQDRLQDRLIQSCTASNDTSVATVENVGISNAMQSSMQKVHSKVKQELPVWETREQAEKEVKDEMPKVLSNLICKYGDDLVSEYVKMIPPNLSREEKIEQLYSLMTNCIDEDVLQKLDAAHRKLDFTLYDELARLREDFSLERAWPRIRISLGGGADLPANNEQARDIRNWLNDEEHRKAIEGVTKLDLFGTNLLVIPDEIGKFTNLLSLSINKTHINIVRSEQLAKLTRLQFLSLCSSPLKQIHLPDFPRLKRLWLYFNKLSEINIPNCPCLEEILLYNNRLTEVNIPDLPLLTHFNLSNNPLPKIRIPNSPYLWMHKGR